MHRNTNYRYRPHTIKVFGCVAITQQHHCMTVLRRPLTTAVVDDLQSGLKFTFHGSSFLVASSQHPRRHVRRPRDDATKMSGVSGDFPVQLATRLPDWLTGGLLRCSAASFSVCRVVLQSPRARHARLVADKSLASSYSIPGVRHA